MIGTWETHSRMVVSGDPKSIRIRSSEVPRNGTVEIRPDEGQVMLLERGADPPILVDKLLPGARVVIDCRRGMLRTNCVREIVGVGKDGEPEHKGEPVRALHIRSAEEVVIYGRGEDKDRFGRPSVMVTRFRGYLRLTGDQLAKILEDPGEKAVHIWTQGVPHERIEEFLSGSTG